MLFDKATKLFNGVCDEKKFELWLWPQKKVDYTDPTVYIGKEKYILFCASDFDDGIRMPYNPTSFDYSFVVFFNSARHFKNLRDFLSDTTLYKLKTNLMTRTGFTSHTKVKVCYYNNLPRFKKIVIS